MNPFKRLARFILRKELENDKFHFKKLGNANLAKFRRIKALETEINRLRIKCEQMRQEILKFTEKRPHFKHKPKKGMRK